MTFLGGSKPTPYEGMEIHKVIMREQLGEDAIFEELEGAGVRVKKILKSGATLLANARKDCQTSSELVGWVP